MENIKIEIIKNGGLKDIHIISSVNISCTIKGKRMYISAPIPKEIPRFGIKELVHMLNDGFQKMQDHIDK